MPHGKVSSQEFVELTSDIPDIREIANLPPEKRKDYGRLAVHEFLKKHSEGTVVDQVAEATGLSRKTVYNHLEVLCALRKAYRREWGPRRIIYYPMDSAAGARPDSSLEMEGRTLTFQEVENQFGEFLHIQERAKDPSGAMIAIGGILVPRGGIKKLVNKLREFEEG